MITQGRANNVVIRMHASAREKTMAYLQEQWTALRPGFPFTSYTIAERFNSQYEDEERQAKLVNYFSILAIIIAALGLFGLSSFTAEQRFREIGIRKILGASVSEILLLLNRKFTWLVLIAFVIACPAAWLLMDYLWMDRFAYQGDFASWPFLLAGASAFLVAWLTVGYHSLKAARSNPVEAIRRE